MDSITIAEGRLSIGENIRRRRIASSLSQGALALRAGLVNGQPQVSQYETGKTIPTIGQLKLIAAGLCCTVADLVEGV